MRDTSLSSQTHGHYAYCALNHPTTMDLAAAPRRIFLIEDAVSDALLTRKALDACNLSYALTILQRGNELLPRLLKSGNPDLILLDFGLPDMDGFEVLAELAKQSPAIRSIPIVIITGYKDFDYIREIYPLSIIGYLNKPCRAEDMQTLMAQL